MLLPTFGLAIVVLAGLADAFPTNISGRINRLPIQNKIGSIRAKDLLTKERARIGSFAAGISSGPLINEDVSYVCQPIIGTQTFSLIVDTGSSNIVLTSKKYVRGPTGINLNEKASITYGSGFCSGTEYTDTVTLAGVTVKGQAITVCTSSSGFSGVDGIFGFGPVDLTTGVVAGVSTIPTFLDHAYSQGSIPAEVVAFYFAPENGSDTADANGEITLGGPDSSKYTGVLTWIPKSSTGDFAYYWGITVTSVTYGSTTLLGSNGAIVDTGTTLIYIPTPAYSKFLTAAGGKTDSSSGLAIFTTKPSENVTFTIAGRAFALTPTQYLVPTAQYANFGLTSGKYYAWINDGGASDIDMIIGQKFLENYYSLFDITNSRIGLATPAS